MQQFRQDVILGLSKPSKTLPSKYFYDAKGDELFIKIMAMPEYYLTRAEMDIFDNKTEQLAQLICADNNKPLEIIELGAGDGTKTAKLLAHLQQIDCDIHYYPVDISANALQILTQHYQNILPELKVSCMCGDYIAQVHELSQSNHPKVILFLGSNIGNLTDEKAHQFMLELSKQLNKGDKIVLGVDLIKSKDIVLPAYDDAKGITSDFNINLLCRINKELGANFDCEAFEHCPEYDEQEGIARSFVKALKEQEIDIDGEHFHIAAGEKIQTECSRKYNDVILNQIIADTGLSIENKILDDNEFFADYILVKS